MSENDFPSQDQKLLLKVCARSLIDLVRKDRALFEREVHEQALAHRLAVYIEKYFQSELPNFACSSYDLVDMSVDCEYNRHGYEEKKLRSILDAYPDKKSDIVRPDIVLHIRGSSPNLMIVEMTKGDESAFKYAFDKVSAFVESEYAYELGVVVRIGNDSDNGNPIVQIATVRKQSSAEDNKSLLSVIERVIGSKNEVNTARLGEDESPSIFDDYFEGEDYRASEEDYEERLVHSDDVNEMWWTDSEEGWPYDADASDNRN